jgi:ribosome maturation factor RimP
MRLTPLEERIAKLIEPTLAGLGYDLVCVQETGEGIQVIAENPATGGLGMDDCAKISRAVGAVLDVEDPIERSYRLEVSSPGIDRLLIRLKDYETHLGLEAKIEMEIRSNC